MQRRMVDLMTRRKKGGPAPCDSNERPQAAEERAGGPELDDELVDDAEAIDREIETLRSELDDVNSKWLRALADLDNYKKRVTRDRSRWIESVREETILPFLDVVDNFERAMQCVSPDDEGCDVSFREGVDIIFRHLMEVLEKQGVRPIEAVGEEFDPELHEAVSCVESDEHETNTVIEEIRKGYMLGDRLLRPSRVIVAG